MDLQLNKNAIKRIAHLMQQDNKKALRISVDGGGCSGFMYQYNLVDEIKEDDYIIENDNVKVIIDPVSRQFLKNCTVEFIEELGSSYFQISNPNATAKCGCGNSFSV